MSTQGSSKFHIANTNSIMSHKLLRQSGSFQANKGRGPIDDVQTMVTSIKEWLNLNHDESHDMIQEAMAFLDKKNYPQTHPNT
jgi:hypothetical protein